MLRIINNLVKFPCNLIGPEAAALPIGTTFLGRIGLGGSHTLGIKTYAGIVDLIDLQKTWVGSPTIDGYQEVDAEVIIKEIK
ncbi:MAG: hypothetical protein IMZ43_09560 [Thermoplasmata archaeon]|nr:hypothetical protein [Thermoplasmata archaeon]